MIVIVYDTLALGAACVSGDFNDPDVRIEDVYRFRCVCLDREGGAMLSVKSPRTVMVLINGSFRLGRELSTVGICSV